MARRTTKKKDLTPEEKLAQALVPVEEQPYRVPGNWCWVYLISGFAECLDGFRKPINASERATRIGDVPYYGATGQVGWIDDYLTDEELVLLGEDGAPFLELMKDKAYIISGKAWVNNHAHILKSFYGHVGNLYLVNYLNCFNFTGYVNGTTRLKLTQASMNTIPISLPPLPEQQRIVARIESLFAKLDEAKEKAQAVVDGFEERKAAILHKAFTGELTKKWREENKIKTTEWNKDNLANIASVVSGYAFSSSDFISSNPIPCIKITNVGVGEFIAENYEYLPDSFIADYAKFVVKKGDILISLTRSFIASGLKVCIYPSDSIALLNQRVALIRNCNVGYVYYYLRSDEALNYVKSRSKTTNQPNLSIKDLKEMIIPLAAEEEQIEIVRILDQFFLSEEKAMDATEQVLDQIDTMKKAILARAFRGELGTNDPQEESAVELVRRALSKGGETVG